MQVYLIPRSKPFHQEPVLQSSPKLYRFLENYFEVTTGQAVSRNTRYISLIDMLVAHPNTMDQVF